MRTRDRDQDWIEELGRRRLEALIAELSPPVEPASDDPRTAPTTASSADLPEPTPAGRHARRALSRRGRVAGWLGDRLPSGVGEQWAARRTMQAGHVGVLALLLAVAVVLGGWGWVRASGDVAVTPPPPPSVSSPTVSGGLLTAAPSGSSSGAATPRDPAGEVVVHVAGKVVRPGIVVLPSGSRVVDAVRRAGGFAPGVGPRSAALNLARVLVDGEQIVVGGPAGASVPAAPGGPGSPGTGALVSLNTADQGELETLPGVGPVTAAAILQWRTEHGPFTAVEQLLEVSGIGEATLAELQPHVTL